MDALFVSVLTASFQGSIVILAVLALRLLLKRAPKSVFCLLWLLAGLRLALPFEIQSSLSLQPDYSFSVEEVGERAEILDRNGPVLVGQENAEPMPQMPTLPEGKWENQQSVSYLYKVEAGVITGPLSWGDLAAQVWLLGMGIMVAASAYSYLRLKRRVREACLIENGCYECPGLDTAFVLGFFPPRIYLPMGLNDQDKQYIYDHENTHIARHDHWCKFLGYGVLALHWFNPLVWIAYALLCRDIELACDEHVVKNMSISQRKAYSAALLACGSHTARIAACPVAFGESNPRQRIVNVLNYKRPTFWISLLAVIAVVFVAVCLMTSPQEKDPMERLSRALEAYQSRGAWHIQSHFTYENRPAAAGLDLEYWEDEGRWYRVGSMHLADGNQQTTGYVSEQDTQYTFFVSGVYYPEFRRWSLAEGEQRWYPYWLPRFELKKEKTTEISEKSTEDGSVITTVLDPTTAGEQYTQLSIRWYLDKKGNLTHVERYEQFTTTEDGETFLMGIQMDISLLPTDAETVKKEIDSALEEIPENIRQETAAEETVPEQTVLFTEMTDEDYLALCIDAVTEIQRREQFHISETLIYYSGEKEDSRSEVAFWRDGENRLRESYVPQRKLNNHFFYYGGDLYRRMQEASADPSWTRINGGNAGSCDPWLCLLKMEGLPLSVVETAPEGDTLQIRLLVRGTPPALGWDDVNVYNMVLCFDRSGNLKKAVMDCMREDIRVLSELKIETTSATEIHKHLGDVAAQLPGNAVANAPEHAIAQCRDAMVQLQKSENLYLYVTSPEDPGAPLNVYMKASNGWMFQYRQPLWDYRPVIWLRLGNEQYLYAGETDENGVMQAPYFWQTEPNPDSHSFQLPYPFDLDWRNLDLTCMDVREEGDETVIILRSAVYLDDFTFRFGKDGRLIMFRIDDSTGEPEAKPISFQVQFPYDGTPEAYLKALREEAAAQLNARPKTPDEAFYEELFARETDGVYTAMWIDDLYETLYTDPAEFARQLSGFANAEKIALYMGYELQSHAPYYYANVLKQLEADPQTDSAILSLLQSIG